MLGQATLARAAAPQSPGPDLPPVTLANTAVHELVAPNSRRTYQVWVDVPASYALSEKKLPVVLVLDAPYAFPLVRSIRNLLGQRGRNLEDFVLLGLNYANGDTAREGRNRDYTPTDPRANPRRHPEDDYEGSRYGEADALRDFLEQQVLAWVERSYRVDMQRKVLVGHSYGALFGTFVLLSKPAMFQSYILSSPSLWFDDKVSFELERRYAAQHKDLPAQVLLSAGSFETIRPGPRYFKTTDLVKDMQTMQRNLRSRHYPSLRVDAQVVADEDHFTVFPSAVSRGLRWALPGFGPYSSG
jgi:uncharacterized protein